MSNSSPYLNNIDRELLGKMLGEVSEGIARVFLAIAYFSKTRGMVSEEELLDVLVKHGLDRVEAQLYIVLLRRRGFVYEPKKGFLKKV